MISIQEFATRVRVGPEVVETWVVEGWLLPKREADLAFSEVDVARACLIRDLKTDFGVNNEGISLVLHLLDQMHGLRRSVERLAQQLRNERSRRTAES
jgi:chaperone modulatory protein CbpM